MIKTLWKGKPKGYLTKMTSGIIIALMLRNPMLTKLANQYNQQNNQQAVNLSKKIGKKLEKRGVRTSSPLEEMLTKGSYNQEGILKNIKTSHTESIKEQSLIGPKNIYKRLTFVKGTLEDLIYGDLILNVGSNKIHSQVLKGMNRNDLYYLTLGVLAVESSGNEKAYNPYGAYGLGQITKFALEEYNNIVKEYHPEVKANGKTTKLEEIKSLDELFNGKENVKATLMYLNHLWVLTTPPETDNLRANEIFERLNIDQKDLTEKEKENILRLYYVLKQYSGNGGNTTYNEVLAEKYTAKVLEYARAFKEIDEQMRREKR